MDEIFICVFVRTDDHDPSIEELSVEMSFQTRDFVSSDGAEVFVTLIEYLVCVLIHEEGVCVHVGNLLKLKEIPKVKAREDVLEPLSLNLEWW